MNKPIRPNKHTRSNKPTRNTRSKIEQHYAKHEKEPTQDHFARQIAHTSALVILTKALNRFRKQDNQRFRFDLPEDHDGLLEYVNRLQGSLDELREAVGNARYQLTGSRGTA